MNRDKAFLGTAMAVASIGAGILKGFSSRRKAKKAKRKQRRMEAESSTNENINAMNQAYNEPDETNIDDNIQQSQNDTDDLLDDERYKNRQIMKYGGFTRTATRAKKVKNKKAMYNKAELGTKFSIDDYDNAKYTDRLKCGGKRKMKRK